MTLAKRPEDGSLLRIEMDVYRDEDGTLRPELDMMCPIDDFETTLACFKAAIAHLGKQMVERRKCPFHPDNNPMDEAHAKV